MPFEFKEHEADVALVAMGTKLEECFAEGGRGLFDVQADLSTVAADESVEIKVKAPDFSALFVEWLNALLAQRDIKGMLFSRFEVRRIYRWGDNWCLTGIAWGEQADQSRHTLRTEVKAATYCGLSYEIVDGTHILQCVLDV